MSDVTYRVAIEFATSGNLGADLGRHISKLDGLSGSISRIGHEATILAGSLSGAFERAVDGAFSLAGALAKVGATAALGTVTYGTLLLNKELENTQIALAAIFGANGITSSMPEGMTVAADVMTQMRKDAAALPGQFRDLVGIFKTISVPGFQAGASVDQVRDVAAQTMAVSQVMGLPMEQASREMAMLLEGRAGAHNVLGIRLAGLAGERAEAFNKLPAADRLAAVRRELEKFAPAIEAYSHSFEGLSSTLIDHAKQFLSLATMPLFDRIKHSLSEINTYFDTHEHDVEEVANTVGRRLAAGWDEVESIVKRIGPVVGRMADDIVHMQPADLAKKLEHAGEIGLAIKLAPTAMRAGSSMLGWGLDAFGGADAVGGVAALTELGTVALPAVAATAFVAAGAVDDLTDKMSVYHDSATDSMKKLAEQAEQYKTTLQEVGDRAKRELGPAADTAGDIALGALANFKLLGDASDQRAASLSNYATKIDETGDAAEGAAMKMAHALKLFYDVQPEETARVKSPQDAYDPGLLGGHFFEALANATKKNETKRGPAAGGGGGVHVDRVEITVASNLDPNRVARVIAGHLADLARYRKSSAYVPNFSASRS